MVIMSIFTETYSYVMFVGEKEANLAAQRLKSTQYQMQRIQDSRELNMIKGVY